MNTAETIPTSSVTRNLFSRVGLDTDVTDLENVRKSRILAGNTKRKKDQPRYFENIQTGTSENCVIDFVVFQEQRNSQTSPTKVIKERPFEEDMRSSLRAQIAKLREVADNWDGFGSQAPDSEMMRSASYLIDRWDWSISLLPEIGLLSDGEICFEFYSTQDDLIGALDLLNHGQATFAFTVPDAFEAVGAFDIYTNEDRENFFDVLRKAKASSE